MSRDVRAAVPIRIPPGTCADESPDTAFSGDVVREQTRKTGSEEGCIRHTVDGDADEIANFLDLRPSQLEGAKIPEHEVTICSAGLELVPILDELICQRLCVFDHLLRICLPGRLHCLQKRGCDAGDGIIVGPTLACREHGIIHAFLEVLVSLAVLAEKDETCARPTERFVSMRVLLRRVTVPRNWPLLTLS